MAVIAEDMSYTFDKLSATQDNSHHAVTNTISD